MDIGIRFEKKLDKDDNALLCKWSNKWEKAFKEQWMKTQNFYSPTYAKIIEMKNKFYTLNGEIFLGII